MFERITRTMLMASALALPLIAQASVDLDKILGSQDFALIDSNGVSLRTLRAQVVTDADITVSSPTALNTSWLRLTHLGAANNSIYNISIEVVFPPEFAGQLLWQALGPNGTGQGTYPIDASGKATLIIPNINRGFTAEIRLPRVESASVPTVNVIAADGFSDITAVDTPRRPKY